MSYWDKNDITEMLELHQRNNINCPVVTSVAKQEAQEVVDIITAIDEALFYDGAKPVATPIAKPREVISVLVQVLVSKGLLSLQDVQRALNTKSESSGT